MNENSSVLQLQHSATKPSNNENLLSLDVTYIIIFSSALLAIAFGLFNTYLLSKVNFDSPEVKQMARIPDFEQKIVEMRRIASMISEGATEFLKKEYTYMIFFMIPFCVLLSICVERKIGHMWTIFCFVIGCGTSILSGFIGMKIAVYANIRTSFSAIHSLQRAFIVAFRGGCVLGFCLVGFGLMNISILIIVYKYLYLDPNPSLLEYEHLFDRIAGYGLGGSTIALFGRVGGGIFTKAADVGADLVGKLEEDLEENSPDNPATIADNVGDNVGDIAGMGSDLFGSFAESICACLVVSSSSQSLMVGSALFYPLLIPAIGLIVCIFTSFVATHVMSITEDEDVQTNLKYQLIIATVLMTIALFYLTLSVIPTSFTIHVDDNPNIMTITTNNCYLCLCCGLWSGLIIGGSTEYFTSYYHSPVQNLGIQCHHGAANNLMGGLALGYISTVIPAICLAFTIYLSYLFAGMYGISLSALGMLSTMSISLAVDGYGPISDNAGGINNMAELPINIIAKTDILDAAGNTTAAIGKGYAIGSASLVSLALFGAFITRCRLSIVDILSPLEFTGLMVGAMLPYCFSAITLKSVGTGANKMVFEIRQQFAAIDMDQTNRLRPDYKRCISILTHESISQMIAPGCLVLVVPFCVGGLFGPTGVAGILAGALVSGIEMVLAISATNSGGAWDNTKKMLEKNRNRDLTGTPLETAEAEELELAIRAAIIGDTVGDPLKDISGPSLNILVKLMSIFSLVFAHFFKQTQYLNKLF